MAIACEDYGNVCVIAVPGDLAAREAADLCHVVEDRLRRGSANIVINLQRSGFLSSQGLEALLEARRQCAARRGQLKLACLDENCRTILQITRLGHQFECHSDLSEAMKVIGS